ncbi:TPA: RNA-binding protein, partial [Pseudomonas aeruginosa]
QQHGVLRKLVDDGARLEQEYLVEVAGDLAAGGLERLRHGLAYQGRRLSPCKVSWQNESHLRFALKDVLPGQLRFMCESEGLEVRSIRRLRIGALSLARLPLGEWRYLGLHERF